MKVQRLYTQNSLRNYDYILTTTCGKTIVVDPSDPRLLQQYLKQVDYYFITHEHPDHVAGLSQLQKKLGGKVVAFQGLAQQMTLDLPVTQGDRLELEGESFHILHIPGHIMSHIGFISEGRGGKAAAFLGDTVFNAGVGNTHSGDPQLLCRTILDKVLTLNPQLTLYPEHDYWESNLLFTLSIEPENTPAKQLLQNYQQGNYHQSGMFPPATLAQERQYNLFFRTHLPQVQSTVRQHCHLPQDCSQEAIFIGLRKLRDQW